LVTPINIGAIVGLASVVFVSLYGQSRVFFSMARDGFLWPQFASVHPKFHTPAFGTIVIGIFAALLAAVFPFDVLADLVSIGTLAAFIAVCAGILILRVTAPTARRQFRTPYVWFTAPAGIVVCGVMMVSLGGATWLRLLFWTAIGLLIYFGYGVYHAAPSKWSIAETKPIRVHPGVPITIGVSLGFVLLSFVNKADIYGQQCYYVGALSLGITCIDPWLYWAAWMAAIGLLLTGAAILFRKLVAELLVKDRLSSP
ncbi:MAG: amino acid permease, partial [Alphaproteobacteria bacterium]|nr:amino acid permease [Alphaproteobacteria bacterium]